MTLTFKRALIAGLAVEHYQAVQTQWNGNGGAISSSNEKTGVTSYN